MDETRRVFLGAAAGLLVTGGAQAGKGAGQGAGAWDFSFPAIDEGKVDFATLRGRVLLVTNTASFCGYTYQYDALEKLHQAHQAAGLTVIGVPSQDFNQESATNGEVKTFCDTRFGIDFPLTAISHVKGADAAPFYAWVRGERGWEPQWNFNKVLIGRDGRILATFGSGDEPAGPAITAALTPALAAQA